MTMVAASLAPSLLVPMGVPSDISITMSCDSVLDDIRKRALDPPGAEFIFPDVHASGGEFASPVNHSEVVSDSEETPMVKKRRVDGVKRAQIKYEPPMEIAKSMTKEEIAAWRREQRRKRNRESAAASRQRQKDRIVELEEEVDEWKSKYEDILKEIHRLDSAAGLSSVLIDDGVGFGDVRSSNASPIPLSVFSHDVGSAAPVSPTQVVGSLLDPLELKEEVLLPTKMISRPAATRIYHPDMCRMADFQPLTA